MTDYERGYEQGKTDATKKMHPEIRKFFEDYFDKCFKEYQEHLRPWVGLTDEDKSLFSSWLDQKTDDEVFTAIEDKLRSKNT